MQLRVLSGLSLSDAERRASRRRALQVRFVADVLLAVLTAHRSPAEAARDGLDDIPGIEGIGEGVQAERPADVGFGGVKLHVRPAFRSDDVGAVYVVVFPGVGEEVQDGEDSHFNAEEQGGDADFDVGGGYMGGFFDDIGGGEEVDDYLGKG